MHIRIVIICALICGLASIGVQSARAQSSLEVPGPSNQYQPYVPPQQAPPPVIRLAPSGGDSGNTIQLLPGWNQPPAQPQPAPPPPTRPPVNVAPMTAQAAPALPAVFRGCWQGQVSELDWIRSELARTKSASGRRRHIGSATNKSAISRFSSPSPKPASRRATRLSIRTDAWCRSRPMGAPTPPCARGWNSTNTRPTETRFRSRLHLRSTKSPTRLPHRRRRHARQR